MKRHMFILLILILAPLVFPLENIAPSLTIVRNTLDDLKDAFPRHEGSKAEKQVISYIKNTLSQLSIQYTNTNFNASDSFHSFSENISVVLTGDKKDSLIILVPLNHPLDAKKEESGLINIALALSLISYYSYNKPPITLQFVFLGAEYGEKELHSLGSTLYLTDFFPDYPVMLIYLSFKTIPRRVIVDGAGKGIITPYWYTIRCSEALKEADLPFLISGNKNQLFRLGLAREKTPIEPFLQAGFPSISLSGIDTRNSKKDLDNWIFSFCIFIDILVQKSTRHIPEYWDQHYLFFQVYDFYLIIQENLILIIFIAVFSISVIIALVYHNRIRSYIKHLFKYFWVIPLFFITTLAFLVISTFSIQGILQLRRDITLWEIYPFLFLGLKLSIAVLLFVLCLKLIRFIPIPMTRRFYSTLTISLLLIDILLISLINISFVYYYLWAFFFIFLAFLFNHRIIRLLLILPSPYWIIKLLLDFFIFIPEPVFYYTVLFSHIKGNIVISLLILPFISLFVNIFLFFFPARHKRSRVQYNVITLFLILLNGTLFTTTMVIPHFSENRYQDVTARNIIDLENYTHYIEVESDSPLGEISIRDSESEFSFNTDSRKYTIPKKYIPNLLTIKTTQTPFLNRNNVTINIQSQGTPYEVYFDVRAERAFTIYDSNFPFRRSERHTGYEILIGANPPSPLEIQLTLTKDVPYEFSLQIDYLNIPFEFTARGKNKTIRSLLTLKKKITLNE